MRIQSATRVLLQKELIIPNTKLLLKMTNSNLKKTWTNTALFEFGLAKSGIRQLPWPKMMFKDYFLTLFDFTLQGPFTRWVNNKLKQYKSHLYFIFSIIFESTLLHPVSQNALRSWWQQTLGKMEQWLIFLGKPRAVDNMHSFYDLST